MRKFIDIVTESITHDPAQNHQIEQKIATHSPEDRPMIMDGLEAIMNFGEGGCSVQQWVNGMRTMWPGSDNDRLKAIFRIVVKDFSQFVTRTDGQYCWNGSATRSEMSHGDDTIDMNDPMTQMAHLQITLTNQILHKMKEMGTFTVQDIVHGLQTIVPPSQVEYIVQHVIESNSGSIRPIGGGNFRYEEVSTAGRYDFWRSLDGYQPPREEI